MGLTPARWLVDTSVLARLRQPQVRALVQQRLSAGLLGVALPTELEMGYAARSATDWRRLHAVLVAHLIRVPVPFRAEARAREVQLELLERGHHRSAGVADLMVAAIAEIEGLAVLHYDADFDTIAAITGQDTEWIVPKGSID